MAAITLPHLTLFSIPNTSSVQSLESLDPNRKTSNCNDEQPANHYADASSSESKVELSIIGKKIPLIPGKLRKDLKEISKSLSRMKNQEIYRLTNKMTLYTYCIQKYSLLTLSEFRSLAPDLQKTVQEDLENVLHTFRVSSFLDLCNEIINEYQKTKQTLSDFKEEIYEIRKCGLNTQDEEICQESLHEIELMHKTLSETYINSRITKENSSKLDSFRLKLVA